MASRGALSGRSALRLVAALLAALTAGILISQLDVVTHRRPFSAPVQTGLAGTYYSAIDYIIAPFVLFAPAGHRHGVELLVDGAAVRCGSDRRAIVTGIGAACAYTSGHIYFATPDGGDPRHDGRTYSIRHPIHVHPYLALAALLIACALARLSFLPAGTRLSALRRYVGAAGLAAGIGLTALNLAGHYTGLRSEGLAGTGGFTEDGTLSYRAALEQLAFRTGDTPLSFSHRASNAIAQSVVHRWDHDLVRIPARENWILHVLGLVRQDMREYIFWDHRKTLERGIGLCGHVSSALVGFLREQGIDARTVGLYGHVVVTAEVAPGEWHVLDPDFGIVIPHAMATLERRADLVRAHYEAAVAKAAGSPEEKADLLDKMVGFYTTPENNQIDPSGRLGYYSGLASPAETYGQRERLLYILKWAIPPALLLLGALLLWPPVPALLRSAAGSSSEEREKGTPSPSRP